MNTISMSMLGTRGRLLSTTAAVCGLRVVHRHDRHDLRDALRRRHAFVFFPQQKVEATAMRMYCSATAVLRTGLVDHHHDHDHDHHPTNHYHNNSDGGGGGGGEAGPSSPIITPAMKAAGGRSSGEVTFSLPTPHASSHEALAFSACPLCHAPSIHLREMKSHLMAVHRGAFDEALYDRACEERLALYDRVIGNPLPRPDEAELRRRDIERKALLPAVTDQGHYVCNWCLIRQKPFMTRDAFLQHVALKHPEQDMDEVEAAVPPPPVPVLRGAGAGGTAAPLLRGGRGAGAGAASRVSTGPSRRLPGVQPLLHQAAEDFKRTTGGRGPAADQRLSLRYSPRQTGISVPRHLDVGVAREAREVMDGDGDGDAAGGSAAGEAAGLSHTTTTTAEALRHRARSTRFGNGRFPCELCGRVLVSELDLLQHLEGRHPEVNAPGVPSGNGLGFGRSSRLLDGEAFHAEDANEHTSGSAANGMNLGNLMRAEMGGGKKSAAVINVRRSNTNGRPSAPTPAALSGQIIVSCDLCSSSKVYTLASALFAHIRFKHPAEDAAFHVERLIEASKHVTQRYICSYCNKAFSSDDALQGHVTSKHQTQPDSPTVTRNPATAGLLGVVAEKNQWWCNECEKGFRSGRALLGHKVAKHLQDLKSHNCPACKRVFTDVFSLEEHMKQVHPTLSIDDLGLIAGVLCQFCDRRFLDVKDLQQHLLRHHPGKATLTKEAPVVSTAGGVGFVDPLRRNTVPLHPGSAKKTSTGVASPTSPTSATSGASSSPLMAAKAFAAGGIQNHLEEEGGRGRGGGGGLAAPVPGEYTSTPMSAVKVPQKPRKVVRKKA